MEEARRVGGQQLGFFAAGGHALKITVLGDDLAGLLVGFGAVVPSDDLRHIQTGKQAGLSGAALRQAGDAQPRGLWG